MALSTGSNFQNSVVWTTAFSYNTYWANAVGYYGAIRLGDVNGDEMADLIARGNNGIYVLLSSGHSFIADKSG